MSEPVAKKPRFDESPDIAPGVSYENDDGGEGSQAKASDSTTMSKPLSFEEVLKSRGYDDVTDFVDQMRNTQKELEELKGRLNNIASVMGNIASVMAPASIYALMETAVYDSIDDSFESKFDRSVVERAKCGVTKVCSLVLEAFLNKNPQLLENKNWSGPGVEVFPKNNRLPVIIQGLRGLCTFVDKADKEDILCWSVEKRNGLSRNGTTHLDCLYKTPEKEKSTLEYNATKEKVKVMRSQFKEEGKRALPFETLMGFDNAMLKQYAQKYLKELVETLEQKVPDFNYDDKCEQLLEEVWEFLVGL